jgi:hypothetical protein
MTNYLFCFVMTGMFAAGVYFGFRLRRLQPTDSEVSIDGVKEALVRLKKVVQALEATVGINLPDEEPQSTGTDLLATPPNLKQVEKTVDGLSSRIQNVTDRIPPTATGETNAFIPKADGDSVPRRIEFRESAPETVGDNRQASTIKNNVRLHLHPTPRVPAVIESHDPAQAVLISIYNQAVEDRNLRGEFQERFRPLRIGTINASDRRRDPALPPEYKAASDGNFLAIQDSRRMSYLIVPRFDLTVKSANYEAGAIGTIFDCGDWNPALSYSKVMLGRPAVFEKNGETWLLKTPGVLDLGQGE